MAGSFFLDKTDVGSWRELNGLAFNVPAAAASQALDRVAP